MTRVPSLPSVVGTAVSSAAEGPVFHLVLIFEAEVGDSFELGCEGGGELDFFVLDEGVETLVESDGGEDGSVWVEGGRRQSGNG